MAWLTTDWEKELEQVEIKVNEVLDEKVEPMTERMLAKASAEMATIISKASFEIHETSEKFFAELTAQRAETMKDVRALIRYAAVTTFIVVVASAAVFKYL